jgi:hypothetical protein
MGSKTFSRLGRFSALAVMSFSIVFIAGSMALAEDPASGGSWSGASSSGTQDPSAAPTTGTTAQPARSMPTASPNFEVIEFQKGAADLNEGAKGMIRSLVDKARAQGEVKRVHIAAWSDKPFPKGKMELQSVDKELATKRIDAIESYVKSDLKISGIEYHNMAKKTGWLARAFNTEDAELKSLFAQRGAPVTSHAEFQALKNAGGPSKALVWIEMAPKK